MGIGSVNLRLDDGLCRMMTEVRYVPGLKRNLISLGCLDNKGYTYKAEGRILRISSGALVIMKGIKKGGLYILQGNTITPTAGLVIEETKDMTKLWHLRLGHISRRGID